MADAVLPGDDHVADQAEKEAVLDNAGARVKLGAQGGRIRDGAKVAVNDQVALVGEKGCAVVLPAERGLAAQRFQVGDLYRPAKGDNLDGDGPMRAQGG